MVSSVSLTEQELSILEAAGSSPLANIRRQAVAIVLSRSGTDRDPFWRTPSGASGASETSAKFGLSPGPDFVIPDTSPTVVIESKIGEDGGTVRDKASRIQSMSRAAAARGLVACAVVDGKGWRERPSALAEVIIATDGRTYTLNTIGLLLAIPEIQALVSTR